jgi:hypothetical protein
LDRCLGAQVVQRSDLLHPEKEIKEKKREKKMKGNGT